MKFKDRIYNKVVRGNENLKCEYERYVIEHIEEHYENRLQHWKLLYKLILHYYIKKESQPLIYKKTSKKETSKIKASAEEARQLSTQYHRLSCFYFAKELQNYDVISFDVFDTLLLRPVEKPEDIFLLVGEKLQILDFSDLRKRVEKNLREKNKAIYGNHEVTLKEIYAEIEKKAGIDCEKGMNTEINVEYDLIYPNPYMLEVFKILKSKGKKIIAISDMYLNKNTILKFLKKCGYSVDDLFLSCEYKCNKRSGGLYKQVLCKYANSKIIHIGDNYKTDFENAKAAGIDSKFYRKCAYIGREKYNITGMSELVESVYCGLIYNTLFNGNVKMNPYFEYGYVYGGIYVLGFCNWIKQNVEKEGIEKVLFLSRDGYIYQKVFALLNNSIEVEYVYWSRIAAVLANMENDRYDCIKRLVEHKATSIVPTTIKDVLDILKIDKDDICLEKYCLKENTILCNDNKQYLETAIVENYDKILQKNRGRIYSVRKMLERTIGNCERVAVVDVGWTGSGVLAIKNLVEQCSKTKVYCYLAASKVKGNVSNITACMNGKLDLYIFSQINNRDLYDYHAKANKGINNIFFELFTQATMPSFKGIDENGNYEFDIAEVENYEMIEEIHKGILYFATQYLNIAQNNPTILNIPGRDAFIPYKFISGNVDYFKRYFKHFLYARGVGGSGEMKIETIEDIMNSVGI